MEETVYRSNKYINYKHLVNILFFFSLENLQSVFAKNTIRVYKNILQNKYYSNRVT